MLLLQIIRTELRRRNEKIHCQGNLRRQEATAIVVKNCTQSFAWSAENGAVKRAFRNARMREVKPALRTQRSREYSWKCLSNPLTPERPRLILYCSNKQSVSSSIHAWPEMAQCNEIWQISLNFQKLCSSGKLCAKHLILGNVSNSFVECPGP